jgi:hypothetical protein
MNLAFEPDQDDPCIIRNADGLDLTAEELESAYNSIKQDVEDEISVAPSGIINPEDVHALTLQHIAHTLPVVRHDDVTELGSVIEVPISVDLTPVFKETFCEALSKLGEWNIQERPGSRSQQQLAEEQFQEHGWQ